METFLYALLVGAMLGVALIIFGGIGKVSELILNKVGINSWFAMISGLVVWIVGLKIGVTILSVIGFVFMALGAYSLFAKGYWED